MRAMRALFCAYEGRKIGQRADFGNSVELQNFQIETRRRPEMHVYLLFSSLSEYVLFEKGEIVAHPSSKMTFKKHYALYILKENELSSSFSYFSRYLLFESYH